MKSLNKIAVIQAVLALTGCAHPPQFLADYYDHRDPCQRASVERTGTRPAWCGTVSSTQTVYNQQGRAIGYIRK